MSLGVGAPGAPGSAIQAQLASMAQLAGPLAAPSLMRSQYLSEALRSLEDSSTQNLRTPGSLISNLLADALTRYQLTGANKQLTDMGMSAQRGVYGDALKGAFGPDASPPPPTAPAPAASPAPPISAQPAIGAQDGMANPFTSPSPSPSAPPPQALAAALASPGAPSSGLSSDAVSGMTANPSHWLANILGGNPTVTSAARDPAHNAAVGGVPTSEHIPGNGYAYDFKPPNGMTNAQAVSMLGGAGLPFDQIINEGNHVHIGFRPVGVAGRGQILGMGGAAGPALAPPAPQMAGPVGPSQLPPAGASAPYQVAANGPTPPPPTGGMGGAPAPMQSPPLVPTQGQGGMVDPPHGNYANAQERAYIQSMTAYPQGSAPWVMGMQKAQEIADRARTSLPPSKDMMWGPDGREHALPGMEYQNVAQGPGGVTQADPFGQYHSTSNPNAGAIPAGAIASNGPNGPQVSPMQGMQEQPLTPAQMKARGYAPGSAGSVNPITGDVKVTQSGYEPTQLIGMRQQLSANPQFQESREAAKAYQGMIELAQQHPNGIRAYALRDTLARVVNPKGSVRLGTIEALKQTQGLPANVQAFFGNMTGDGDVPPGTVQQILNAALPFARENYNITRSMNEDNASFARRKGIDPADITVDIGDAPSPFVVGGNGVGSGNGSNTPNAAGAGGMGPGVGAGQGYSPQAIQAEMRRRGLIK